MEICNKCHDKIPFISESINNSLKSSQDIRYINNVICVCEYSGIVKEAIIKFKFENNPHFHRTFSKMLANKIKKMTNKSDFDIILSVPLYKDKQKNRGYNQSLLISKYLSKELSIPEMSVLLLKVKNTKSQSTLPRKERKNNIIDAFQVKNPEKIKGKRILIIDDIYTTGFTLNECSRVLKESGAESVVAAVIASGKKF